MAKKSEELKARLAALESEYKKHVEESERIKANAADLDADAVVKTLAKAAEFKAGYNDIKTALESALQSALEAEREESVETEARERIARYTEAAQAIGPLLDRITADLDQILTISREATGLKTGNILGESIVYGGQYLDLAFLLNQLQEFCRDRLPGLPKRQALHFAGLSLSRDGDYSSGRRQRVLDRLA
jgi:hypothetical protein